MVIEPVNTYPQGQLVRVNIAWRRNPSAWNPYQAFAVGDYVTYNKVIYKASAASTGRKPTLGNVWEPDSGLFDPFAVSLAVKAPDPVDAVVYTLTSPLTILARLDVGQLTALIDTADGPAGAWIYTPYGRDAVGVSLAAKPRIFIVTAAPIAQP